jgi:hypothetical protein
MAKHSAASIGTSAISSQSNPTDRPAAISGTAATRATNAYPSQAPATNWARVWAVHQVRQAGDNVVGRQFEDAETDCIARNQDDDGADGDHNRVDLRLDDPSKGHQHPHHQRREERQPLAGPRAAEPADQPHHKQDDDEAQHSACYHVPDAAADHRRKARSDDQHRRRHHEVAPGIRQLVNPVQLLGCYWNGEGAGLNLGGQLAERGQSVEIPTAGGDILELEPLRRVAVSTKFNRISVGVA